MEKVESESMHMALMHEQKNLVKVVFVFNKILLGVQITAS